MLQCKQMRTVRKWEGSVWCVLVSMRAASGLHEEGRCVEAVPNKTAPGQRGDPSSRSRRWQYRQDEKGSCELRRGKSVYRRDARKRLACATGPVLS